MIDISQIYQHGVRKLIKEFLRRSEEWQDKEFISKTQAEFIAGSIMKRCDAAMNDESQHPFNLEFSTKICQKYGMVHGIARQLGREDEKYTVIARLAQALRQTTFDRQDEALDVARKLLQSAADYYLHVDQKENAAIELTNSALMTLEKDAASFSEIKSAHKTLLRAADLRKAPRDWAFSEFNLGICERMIAENSGYPKKMLESSWHRFRRAQRVFAKNGGSPSGPSYYARNLAQTAVAMMECVRREQYAYRLSTHIADVPENVIESLDPFQIVETLRANPGVFGYMECPAWAQEEVDTSAIDGMLREAQSEIASAVYLCSDRDRSDILWQQWQLKYLTSERKFDELAVDSLNDAWNFSSREGFFRKASKIVGLTCEPNLQTAYNDQLLKVADFLRFIIRKWKKEDIEIFLNKNNLTFRFVATELANSGFFKESFDLLESSRALRFSGALNQVGSFRYKDHKGSSGFTWIHLSHSPRATVVVGCAYSPTGQFEYFSKCFPKLNGKMLSVLFSGVAKDLGLLPLHYVTDDQFNRIKGTERVVNKISDIIIEVADYISCQSRSNVVRISPGGFYQSLPLAAFKGTDQRLLIDEFDLATAPSLSVCLMSKASLNPVPTVYFASADDVSGLPNLISTQREKAFIANTYNLVPVEASKFDMTGLSIPGDILHFSGHSTSSWDPKISALMLQNDTFSVAEVLENGPRAGCVLLSSCESGLAQNFMHQEEYLSLQSAFFYRGANVTVGTMWPVLDFVAFVFFSRMYFELGTFESFGINELTRSFRLAQRWMRTATLLDLFNFFDTCRVPYDLPRGMQRMDPRDKPFESIINWGCFNLMARIE
ncbi:CHAT domain-containing protein [Kocuria rhizophila]|uniref:CHAT domain-containing protein n=1 Tax=Kocuria rhizophila (strain ATCC 9341 / DSM 348 / NBRC 103217 / DC2201) TaxID=378753 RepID=B2GLR1_KOCRD|nr:CHAT domain-containing protein [Kocuria rhizophila]ASE12331.1 CHAT domain-containing protein [Kocuria rhizophila]BAG28595.1 hypothetical protein KRH_02480 [Kocuria rhizophila DC2201]VEH76103.1 CHAT domain [Kocuria rhizophila]